MASLLLPALIATPTAYFAYRRCVYFLGKDEQLRVEMLTETVVVNGPCIKVLNPLLCKSIKRVKAEYLGQLDYRLVKDSITGKERVEKGPKLLFLGPYEEISDERHGHGDYGPPSNRKAITLSQTEYIAVTNHLTGELSLTKGPAVWFPSDPYEVASEKKYPIALQEDEYVRIKDQATGNKMIVKGKTLLFPDPTWKVQGEAIKAITLKSYEYVRLQNVITGKIQVHRGEQMIFPEAHEILLDGKKLEAVDLKVDEYVKIEDQVTGEIRVVTGTGRVFLGPNDTILNNGKQNAVQVDEEHAALVRDIGTGQLRLVTEKQLFFPAATEEIEKVQQLICLADHEAVVVKDQSGTVAVHYGNPKLASPERPRSFFLPPYAEILPLVWSRGLRRETRNLIIERFDVRPQYMWFEFDCRTSDNVELVLECTIFWEATDLEKMLQTTGNLPGDVYNQCRSQFIKKVARVTLKKFMEELHSISNAVWTEDQPFYKVRGVDVHSLEVTRYKCSEARTSEVLQQIIEETTNRLNRLSQAESENEVNIFKMQGQIDHEKLNRELLEIKQEHVKSEARVAGASEAERIAAFVGGLEKDVPRLEDRIEMWKVLRKTDALSVVSGGGGSLYYTPNDVDLSIRTDGNAGAQASKA
mmetsp:Transcript_32078/g.68665  ORF Transcript_32078/g.68665 Transcript_32078/m.68665 type:complete len:641 (-) Transcript_32078:545-2467(-)|eukprot:CAMPEP_0206488884 /NCGR_PEP_ID=MMETSP0324_2-20121206/42742_1 /ASSEMBLY_ACC=CAM_ASM_000836 /TAXON_ID=2866 /ORGANISM="Crypthecodinium cohnii, Strain Seligo" /LENGTH=640 /DNA_ID=CAMNT_0053968121 /DNA_START=27 /DNA_END=1949 /DNA_ORIENTATION=-